MKSGNHEFEENIHRVEKRYSSTNRINGKGARRNYFAGRQVTKYFIPSTKNVSIEDLIQIALDEKILMRKLLFSVVSFFLLNTVWGQAFEIDPSNRHKIQSDSASLSIGPTTYNRENSGMLLFNENVDNPFLCGFGLFNNGNLNKLFFTSGCYVFKPLGEDTLMTLDRNNKRIGILTSEPTSALTVNGDVELSGELSAAQKVTRCASIPAFAFQDLDEDYELIQGLSVNRYVYFHGGTNPNLGYAYSGIQLPQNAELLSLSAYVYDNSANDFVRVGMERVSNETGTANVIFSKETTDPYAANAFTEITDSSPQAPYDIVDNNNYSYNLYFIGAQASSATRLRAVKVCYQHNDLYH